MRHSLQPRIVLVSIRRGLSDETPLEVHKEQKKASDSPEFSLNIKGSLRFTLIYRPRTN